MPRPLDLLAAREALRARALGRRARARAPRPPDRLVTRYVGALGRLVDAWGAHVSSGLEWEVNALGASSGPGAGSLPDAPGAVVGRADAILPPRTEATLRGLLEGLDAFLAVQGLPALVAAFAEDTDGAAADELSRVIGIDLTGAVGIGAGALLDRFREDNILLIRRALAGSLDDLAALLSESQGQRVEGIRRQIQDRFGVTKSRAALIARDQTLKLNGQITMQRQTSLGITRYRWVTSGDERVRPSHKALDGDLIEWINPPLTEGGRHCHPGQDYQCRCTASPELSSLFG